MSTIFLIFLALVAVAWSISFGIVWRGMWRARHSEPAPKATSARRSLITINPHLFL